MGKRDLKIEEPGQSEVEAPAEVAAEVPSPTPPAPSEEQVKAKVLEAQVEATKDLVGSEKALDWGHLNTPQAILDKINHKDPDEGLPEPDDIDWAKQPKGTNSVLTRRGWLLRP